LLSGAGGVRGNEFGKRRVVFVADGVIERERRVTPAAEEIPVAITREIHRDAMKPGRQGGISAETGEATVRANEGILGDLLGIGAIAQKTVSHGKNLGV